MKKNQTIGVVAISLNEEKDMPGFLGHLSHWIDEIVIVDCGSTDKTLQIIEENKFKTKVLNSNLQKAGGYAELRNVGIKACHTDWIINMDIDERITIDLKNEILESINTTQNNGFKYKRLNYFLHRPMKAGGWNTWNNPQLAKKNAHYFDGIIHEKCIIEGGKEKTGQLKNMMLHLNDESYLERLDKSFRYCNVEAKELLRKNVKVHGYQLFIYPILEFFKNYIYKKGLFDGIPGLISAMHSSGAVFRKLALTWDNQNKIEREKLEQLTTICSRNDLNE